MLRVLQNLRVQGMFSWALEKWVPYVCSDDHDGLRIYRDLLINQTGTLSFETFGWLIHFPDPIPWLMILRQYSYRAVVALDTQQCSRRTSIGKNRTVLGTVNDR